MLLPLSQIDSLRLSTDKAVVADWVNILTVIVVSIIVVGGILLLRYYLAQKRK